MLSIKHLIGVASSTSAAKPTRATPFLLCQKSLKKNAKTLLACPSAIAHFSSGDMRDSESDRRPRSNLFGSDPYLQDVKRRMKQEYHEDDRFEADQSQRKVKDRTGEQRKPAYRAELVYAAEISSVLEMFARQLREDEQIMGTSKHGI